MKYEKITIETLEGTKEHIIIDLGDGSFKSFPADENNPEYVAWLNPEVTTLPAEIEEVVESDSTEVVETPSSDTE